MYLIQSNNAGPESKNSFSVLRVDYCFLSGISDRRCSEQYYLQAAGNRIEDILKRR